MTGPNTDDVQYRRIDPEGPEPAVQIAEHVADIAGADPNALQSTRERFDHVIDDLFSNPPEPEARIEVSFTYEGFRITVEQNGHATFVPVHDPVANDAD